MSKKGGFLKGLGIGAAVAGVAALLFAPKSGKETREDIHQVFGEAKDQLSQGLDKIKDASVRVKDDSVKETKELMKRAEKLKERMNELTLRMSSATGLAKIELEDEARGLMEEAKSVIAELKALGEKIGDSTQREVKQLSKDATKSANKLKTTVAPAKKTPAKKPAAKKTPTSSRGAKK